MRRLETHRQRYLVELSPRMWARVGSISRSVFEKLRERASAVAELASETRFLDEEQDALPAGSYPRNAFDLDGSWAIYEVDPHRRSLVVLDIADANVAGYGE